MNLDELKEKLIEEISRRPGAMIVLARLANLLDATAKRRHIENGRNLERTKRMDLEQLKTYENVIALIDGLLTEEQKKGLYNGIREGSE